MQNFAFKFQAVAEKTANIVRGLLYFAAPCIYTEDKLESLTCAYASELI